MAYEVRALKILLQVFIEQFHVNVRLRTHFQVLLKWLYFGDRQVFSHYNLNVIITDH